jgi:putative ABC transport system permease protein
MRRLVDLVIRLFARLVPESRRPRWKEEWRAELDHASRAFAGQRLGTLRVLAMALGAARDGLVLRRLPREMHPASGPRPRAFHGVFQDLRDARRALVASPRFALGVVGSLAIGIAANAAAFSLVNALLFRPFPGVTDQGSLVRIGLARQEGRGTSIAATYDEYLALGDGLRGTSGLSASDTAEFIVAIDGTPTTMRGALVSGNYFEVLGVRPAIGRAFRSDEDAAPGAPPVAVISYQVWRRQFQSSPAALGRFIVVNSTPVQIIGVAPEDFAGLRRFSWGREGAAIWLPLAMGELAWRGADGRPASPYAAGRRPFDFVGRLAPGATLGRVRSEATAVAEQWAAARPDQRKGTRAEVTGVSVSDPSQAAAGIVGLMAVPMIVLTIGCVNAANLFLSRASRRRRETAIRLALGAGRWRLVRQFLVESLVLALAAAAAGLVLTAWGVRLAERSLHLPLPIDHRVLAFTLLTAIVTAIIFGLSPALRATSGAAATAQGGWRLPTGPLPQSRLSRVLVILQMALSLGLLATGGQFVKTVEAMTSEFDVADPGGLFYLSFDLDPLRLSREAGEDFYRRLLERAAALPGTTVGVSKESVFTGGVLDPGALTRVWLPGDAPSAPRAQLGAYTAGDPFRASGLPVIAGRTFTADEQRGRPRVAVVNQAFAKKFLGGNVTGRTFRLARGDQGYAASAEVTVVGIVSDVWDRWKTVAAVYYPVPLGEERALTLFVRFDKSPGGGVEATLREVVRQIDPRVPVAKLVSANDLRDERLARRRWLARCLAGFGVLSLVLAAGGLYGVVSYIVTMRTHEIGVRMALGAEPHDVLRMIVTQALTPAAIGATLGAAGAGALGALVRSKLYGASPVDPVAFGGAVALLLTTMAIASLGPARRAARVDPMIVLREE